MMKIESPAFANGAFIPQTYTRFGDDHNPPLVFHQVPAAANSLALIMEDPDAPHGTFTHWIVFNLETTIQGIKHACHLTDAREGTNDWGTLGYGGPKPPHGEHHYYFRLYALDRKLDLPNGADRRSVDQALAGHVLAEAELMGRVAAPPQP